MKTIFLEKHRITPDRIVFLFCAIVAALWITFEYGMYVGRAENCAPQPAKTEQRWKA